MQGVITGKHVVLHPLTIVRAWGLAAWLGCLWAAVTRRRTTFLGVVHAAPRRAGAAGARAARPGTVVLAARVAASSGRELVLAGPPERWRSP